MRRRTGEMRGGENSGKKQNLAQSYRVHGLGLREFLNGAAMPLESMLNHRKPQQHRSALIFSKISQGSLKSAPLAAASACWHLARSSSQAGVFSRPTAVRTSGLRFSQTFARVIAWSILRPLAASAEMAVIWAISRCRAHNTTGGAGRRLSAGNVRSHRAVPNPPAQRHRSARCVPRQR